MIDADSYIGKRIGNYRVITRFASSALTCVFQVEYAGATTAIKLIDRPLRPSKERDRFLQEIRLLKLLRHPHILHVLDFGIYEDLPYVVTEYMPNGSLRDYLNQQSPLLVPVQETIYILLQVGQALDYAHQRNIIHGNLKPENVLFNAQGQALLADFRIETLLNTLSGEQVHNSTMYPYMAPEQFKGVVTKASDQYALGCIAYELFTGHAPFTASDYAEMEQKLASEAPVAPTQHNLLLPRRTEEAILKAMAKQSADRYASVRDLLEALSASLAFRANMLTKPSSNLPVVSPVRLPYRQTHTMGRLFRSEVSSYREDTVPQVRGLPQKRIVADKKVMRRRIVLLFQLDINVRQRWHCLKIIRAV